MINLILLDFDLVVSITRDYSLFLSCQDVLLLNQAHIVAVHQVLTDGDAFCVSVWILIVVQISY